MTDGIDFSQFHEMFMEESFESLTIMETGLLALDSGDPDPEVINNIFRAAHSIKGGAGTFNFARVAEFTHVLETLLDQVRGQTLAVNQAGIDLLLESVDCVRRMLKKGEDDETAIAQARDLSARLIAFGASGGVVADAPVAADATPAAEPEAAPEPVPEAAPEAVPETAPATSAETPPEPERAASPWLIDFRPHVDMLKTGNDPFRLIRELGELGEIRVQPELGALPAFAELDPRQVHLSWHIELDGACSRARLEEVFAWVEGDCEVRISRAGDEDDEVRAAAAEAGLDATDEDAPDEDAIATPAEPVTVAAGADAGLEADGESAAVEASSATTAAGSGTDEAVLVEASPEPGAPESASAEGVTEEREAREPEGGYRRRADDVRLGESETTSVRVNIDKIEQLINLVGELVITQSALAQYSDEFVGRDDINRALQQLGSNIQELQEQSMRIRMLPIDSVFQRLPRLVRDLRTRLGKNVACRIFGNQTEVDKTVLEKIGDPLVHLIRNAIDHGIEAPDDRRALGKSEEALITVTAEHQGGNILISVSDDGRGLDLERIRSKAVSRGLVAPDKTLMPGQIQDLIFAPGFSTAEGVSDVSGRGVGLDVVRQNIRSLGGEVHVSSTPGEGSEFQITLPLTMAVLDGQLVRVGGEVFILPIVNIEKSIRIARDKLNVLPGGHETYRFEDQIIPILRLAEYYGSTCEARRIEDSILVVLNSGRMAGVLVDEVLGQQQVVIRSLETNFRRIETLAGATILGDGSVALIVDANEVVRVTHSTGPQAVRPAHRG